jgi:hypothetical protein
MRLGDGTKRFFTGFKKGIDKNQLNLPQMCACILFLADADASKLD